MNLAEYIKMRLQELEYDVVFGVPGSYVMPLWQKFDQSPGVILARHESGAVYMADGWARITGKPGVVLATMGPGQTNMYTGIAGAYKDSIPILAITGQANPETFGRGCFQECFPLDRGFSPQAIFAPITKGSYEITDIKAGVHLFESALRLAVSGRPGPVHLSIPVTLQEQEIDPNGIEDCYLKRLQSSRVISCDQNVDQIGDILVQSKRPLLFVGWGLYLSSKLDELHQLAEQLSAPVITSIKGLAAVQATHEYVWGHVGPGQNNQIIKLISDYQPDTVLILGASLADYYFDQVRRLLHGVYTIQVDIDHHQLGLRTAIDLGIQADLRYWLPALCQKMSVSNERRDRIRLGKRLLADYLQDRLQSDNLIMAKTIFQLNHILPNDAIVVPDAGNHWLNVLTCYHTKNAGGLFTNIGLGTMGYAIGAAIGMKLAAPERKVICITGDGSTLMSGNEISVSSYLGLDTIFVIYNNSSLGRVRTYQHLVCADQYVASDIPEIDFADWAESMGARGIKVRTVEEFTRGLEQALNSQGTVVIEVIVSKNEDPVFFNQ